MERLGSNLFKCSCGRLFFTEQSYKDHLDDDECSNYEQEKGGVFEDRKVAMELYLRALSHDQLNFIRNIKLHHKHKKELFTIIDTIWSVYIKYRYTIDDVLNNPDDAVKYNKQSFSIN